MARERLKPQTAEVLYKKKGLTGKEERKLHR